MRQLNTRLGDKIAALEVQLAGLLPLTNYRRIPVHLVIYDFG